MKTTHEVNKYGKKLNCEVIYTVKNFELKTELSINKIAIQTVWSQSACLCLALQPLHCHIQKHGGITYLLTYLLHGAVYSLKN